MNTQLPKQIKTLRKSLGYSQKQLAELLHVGQATIANYESGIRTPDTLKLGMLAAIFGVSIDDLLGNLSSFNTTSYSSHIISKSTMIPLLDALKVKDEVLNLLLQGNAEAARLLLVQTCKVTNNLQTTYETIMRPLLYEVGLLWETGKIDVWKEHFISIFIQDTMSELKSLFSSRHTTRQDPVILAFTPGAEQHTIGLRMICDLLSETGYHSIFLGSNVPMLSAILAIEEKQANFVLLSLTLPQHIESAKHVIRGIRDYFGKNSPTIMIGGNAFDKLHSWKQTNADYYGSSYEDVLHIVSELKKQNKV